MNNSLVISYSAKYDRNFLILYEAGKAVEIRCLEDEDSLIDNIYIAKVKNIVKNLEACFVEIDKDHICYYEPDRNREPFFIKRQSPNKLCEGDQIILQVVKDAHKTKQARVTDNLSFTGKYLVLTSGNKAISYSNKLSSADKSRLSAFAKSVNTHDYGLIFRTNAAAASDDELTNELAVLETEYKDTLERAKHKSAYTLLKKGLPDYVQSIISLYDTFSIDKIITDQEDIYRNIIEGTKLLRPEYSSIIELYKDPAISLNALYGAEADIDKALQPRVWLKSGAYLVIEPTEAMTVIDVNTGKYEGNKKAEDTFLKVNKEAAKEIARQMRLRNLSGIIMIDFIDMDRAGDRLELMDTLKQYVNKDPIKTIVVDMTKLNLVEVTRRRIKRSLFEQING